MIYSDLVAITGPQRRGTRTTFVVLTVLSTLLQAAATIALVPVLDRLFGDTPADAWPWVGAMVVALIAASIADNAAARAGLALGLAIADAVESAGFAAIRRLDPADLHSERASRLRDLVASGGVESVSAVVLLGSPIIHAVLLTPLLAIMLLWVSWPLAIVALVGGIAMFAALTVSRKLVARSEDAFADANRELNDRLLEFAWVQPTLRSAGVGTRTLDAVVTRSRSQGLRLLAWQVPGEILFSLVLQLTLIGFGVATGALYLSDDISGTTAAAMIVVLLRVVESTGSLSLLATPMAMAERALNYLRGLIDEQAADTATARVSPADRVPSLTLRDLGFAYPDGTRALDGVDLDIPAGSIAVIVGTSGSGKSTLLDIVSGLREPTDGSVLFDGQPSTGVDRRTLSSVVFQRTELRAGTLRENVLGDRGAVEAGELAEIAERAQLAEIVDAAPEGWNARVGEAANALSGGERQRVGLARALAKPSGLLLVDEATSALDAITERAVVDALRQARGERTVVVVTHRPALVAIADQVIVLADGAIADSGPADELLARGGVFADLWSRWREAENWQV